MHRLGVKWHQKLCTINIGRKLEWPLTIQLATVSGPINEGNEEEASIQGRLHPQDEEDEEIFLLGPEMAEFDAENTEVDNFVIECLMGEEGTIESEAMVDDILTTVHGEW